MLLKWVWYVAVHSRIFFLIYCFFYIWELAGRNLLIHATISKLCHGLLWLLMSLGFFAWFAFPISLLNLFGWYIVNLHLCFRWVIGTLPGIVEAVASKKNVYVCCYQWVIRDSRSHGFGSKFARCSAWTCKLFRALRLAIQEKMPGFGGCLRFLFWVVCLFLVFGALLLFVCSWQSWTQYGQFSSTSFH